MPTEEHLQLGRLPPCRFGACRRGAGTEPHLLGGDLDLLSAPRLNGSAAATP